MAKCVICFSEIAEGSQLCARCLENVTRNQGAMGQPQQGYIPPQQSYVSPQQGYANTQQNFAPPQQVYVQPQYNMAYQRKQVSIPNIIRNPIQIHSVITGVLALAALKVGSFVKMVGYNVYSEYSVNDFAKSCNKWCARSNGAEAFKARLFTFIPILLVIIGIFFIANGVLNIKSDYLYSAVVKVLLASALLIVMVVLVEEFLEEKDSYLRLGLSFWLVWITIISAYSCDVSKPLPMINLTLGEREKNVVLSDGKWICRKCEMSNTGNICKGCGKSKY